MQPNKNNETFHIPVLPIEVVQYLQPQPNKWYVDATFGGGSHTKAILDANPLCNVLALDWDKEAIDRNEPALKEIYGDRLKVAWGNFANLYKILKKENIPTIEGLLADFGTSQFQIHQKAGFSFSQNTPLDMRMSPSHQKASAADLLNSLSKQELAHILFTYGEERKANIIAAQIVEQRKIKLFSNTQQLVSLIETIMPPQPFKRMFGIHPATRTFQALRIVVNQELDNIKILLAAAVKYLSPGGRLVCISFHSLEDRLVKTFFREHEHEIHTLTPKPIVASEEEKASNPSSRSAKLRAAEKIRF